MAKTLNERMSAVAEAPTEDLGELLKLAGLDPARHLRFQEWSGSSFAGSKLQGCDFTGARLLGCDFSGARIAGARFDQADIDHAARNFTPWDSPWGSPWGDQRTNLRAAADWDAYVAGWQRPERLIGDAHLPVGAVFQDAPFAPELVVVPPGEFTMGSPPDEPGRSKREGPQRLVTIGEAFAVGRYAVTFDEWDFAQADKDWPKKITGLKARQPNDKGWGRGNRPVINVSWEDAQAYVKWLSAKTGREYRVPSEAEWEYVARAGTVTPFWWGGSITPAAQTNYDGNYAYDCADEKGEYRERRCRWISSHRTRSGCIRCTVMWTSGSRTRGKTAMTARRLMAQPGQPEIAVAVFFAAVPGATFHGASVRPRAAGAPQTTGTASTASVCPER